MRRSLLIRAAAAVMILAFASSTTEAALKVGVLITIGQRSKGCRDFGICDITIIIETGADAAGGRKGMPADATLEGDTLTLDFSRQLPEKGQVLPLDEDIRLDERSSKALGAKSVTILKGDYAIDRESTKNGRVVLKARVER